MPGKDTTIGRGRIAAALRVNQKLRIADIPIDALQVSRIALPFAERNARVVDKQLMAPGRENDGGRGELVPTDPKPYIAYHLLCE